MHNTYKRITWVLKSQNIQNPNNQLTNPKNASSKTNMGQHCCKHLTNDPPALTQCNTDKATVRVKTPEAVGMEPEQIFISIKAHIPRAVAVKIL